MNTSSVWSRLWTVWSDYHSVWEKADMAVPDIMEWMSHGGWENMILGVCVGEHQSFAIPPIGACVTVYWQQKGRWVSGQMSGWVSGWMGEWVNEWVSEWVSTCISEWVIREEKEEGERGLVLTFPVVNPWTPSIILRSSSETAPGQSILLPSTRTGASDTWLSDNSPWEREGESWFHSYW